MDISWALRLGFEACLVCKIYKYLRWEALRRKADRRQARIGEWSIFGSYPVNVVEACQSAVAAFRAAPH
jgi:hypothetical protein